MRMVHGHGAMADAGFLIETKKKENGGTRYVCMLNVSMLGDGDGDVHAG
jgi:hypothetical protein